MRLIGSKAKSLTGGRKNAGHCSELFRNERKNSVSTNIMETSLTAEKHCQCDHHQYETHSPKSRKGQRIDSLTFSLHKQHTNQHEDPFLTSFEPFASSNYQKRRYMIKKAYSHKEVNLLMENNLQVHMPFIRRHIKCLENSTHWCNDVVNNKIQASWTHQNQSNRLMNSIAARSVTHTLCPSVELVTASLMSGACQGVSQYIE